MSKPFKIKMLTAMTAADGPPLRRYGIYEVPRQIPMDLAKIALKNGFAMIVKPPPETAMLGGDRDNAMLPAGRARNTNRR